MMSKKRIAKTYRESRIHNTVDKIDFLFATDKIVGNLQHSFFVSYYCHLENRWGNLM